MLVSPPRTPDDRDDLRPHVVIVGGGFGGLATARALARAPVRITLVDRRNHHLFQPLLYQVAGAVLSPGDLAAPIRWILRDQANVDVLLAEVQRVDVQARKLHFAEHSMEYDVLVLAAGVGQDYFGHEEWTAHAPPLKSLDDALEARRRILLAYERAEWCSNPDERRRLLTFVVVGGGATGVELAGALCEIASQSLRRDFRHIDPADARVVLVEGGERLLPAFHPRLSTLARQQLEALGVEVRLGERVTDIDADGVALGTCRVAAATVLWAAGVKAPTLTTTLGVPLDRAGRVIVEPDGSVPGHPEVFVIGDLCHHRHGVTPNDATPPLPLPGVAQTALQMGAHVARCLAADRAGQPRPRFRYRDLGSMATVGRSKAVADLAGRRFGGLLAWLIWLFVHLIALVGFRNRVAVLAQWAWSYLSFQRNARLIRGSDARDSVL